MLLSTFIGKQLSLHEKLKGVCVGLSLASKSKKIKGFLCKEDGLTFLLPFTNVDYVTDKIRLKKFTPLPATKSEVFTPFLPVYDENGVLLDAEGYLKSAKERYPDLFYERKMCSFKNATICWMVLWVLSHFVFLSPSHSAAKSSFAQAWIACAFSIP